jgi:hypothetical protein
MQLRTLLCVAAAAVGCGDDDGAGDHDAAPRIDAARIVDAAASLPDAPAGADAASPDAALPTAPVPVAYWSMDQSDVAAGVLADLIGDVDGAVNGPVQDASGQVADALTFDGVDDTIDFGDSLDGVFAGADNAFTVGMWLKPGAPDSARVIFGKSSDTACNPDEDGRQWSLMVAADNTLRFVYQTVLPNNGKSVTSTTALDTPATWYHVAVSYDGAIDTAPEDRVAIYVDGADDSGSSTSVGTFPFDLVDVPARLAAGVRMDSAGAACTESGATFYEGAIDELAIWDRVLTPAEIASVHDRGLAGARLVP